MTRLGSRDVPEPLVALALRTLVAAQALVLVGLLAAPWAVQRIYVFRDIDGDFVRGDEANLMELWLNTRHQLPAPDGSRTAVGILVVATLLAAAAAVAWVVRQRWWWPLSIVVSLVAGWVARLKVELAAFTPGDYPRQTPYAREAVVGAWGATAWQVAALVLAILVVGTLLFSDGLPGIAASAAEDS